MDYDGTRQYHWVYCSFQICTQITSVNELHFTPAELARKKQRTVLWLKYQFEKYQQGRREETLIKKYCRMWALLNIKRYKICRLVQINDLITNDSLYIKYFWVLLIKTHVILLLQIFIFKLQTELLALVDFHEGEWIKWLERKREEGETFYL